MKKRKEWRRGGRNLLREDHWRTQRVDGEVSNRFHPYNPYSRRWRHLLTAMLPLRKQCKWVALQSPISSKIPRCSSPHLPLPPWCSCTVHTPFVNYYHKAPEIFNYYSIHRYNNIRETWFVLPRVLCCKGVATWYTIRHPSIACA